MRLILIFVGLIMVFGMMSAQAWETPKVGAEGAIEEMRQMQWVKEHSHTHEPQYIYDTVEAVAAKEFAENVQRINGLQKGEHYVGR